jgi:hypothetical protein
VDVRDIETRRDQILDEMRGIRSMRRGSITEQMVEDRRNKQAAPVARGPYYVLSRREDGKTVSSRLKPGPELEHAQQEIAAYQRFVGLCREFEQLTEQLGELEHGAQAQEKKRRRWSLSGTSS